MTKKLVWRLGKLPTALELAELVIEKIITKEEAREILFNQEDEVDRDKKSLESEIKFLRELAEKLSNSNSTKIVEIIKRVEGPYYRYPWYSPYTTWCSNVGTSAGVTYASSGNNSPLQELSSGSGGSGVTNQFTSLKTF